MITAAMIASIDSGMLRGETSAIAGHPNTPPTVQKRFSTPPQQAIVIKHIDSHTAQSLVAIASGSIKGGIIHPVIVF